MQIIRYNFLPQRFILAIMVFFGILNAYQMRVILNVAITQMVRNPLGSEEMEFTDPLACPDKTGDDEAANITWIIARDRFDWSEETQGIILSSFYWGYLLTHIPAGILADKYGAKHLLGLSLLYTSIFTVVMPPAARAGKGWIIAVRFLIGIGEGVIFPASNNLLSKWIPPNERACIAGCVLSAPLLGTVSGTLLTGVILSANQGAWPNAFYILGCFGLVWFILWGLLCTSIPRLHPYISRRELEFLEERIVFESRVSSPPWLDIMSSLPVWASIVAQIGHDWALFTMTTDLPKYMKDVQKVSIGTNALLSSCPFLLTWVISFFAGLVSDYLIRRNIWSITTTRKTFTAVSYTVTAIGLIGASYIGCDKSAVVGLFCLGMGAMGLYYPSVRVNALDLSPNYSGTIMALVNGVGASTGIITPYLVGILTPNHSAIEWRGVFWIIGIIKMLSMGFFLAYGSGKIQAWNEIVIKNDDTIL